MAPNSSSIFCIAGFLISIVCVIQVKAVDWPYEDTGDRKRSVQQRNIADYLVENRLDLVINLPMRNGGVRAASSFITQVPTSAQLCLAFRGRVHHVMLVPTQAAARAQLSVVGFLFVIQA